MLLAALALAATTVAGCGGGGGSSNDEAAAELTNGGTEVGGGDAGLPGPVEPAPEAPPDEDEEAGGQEADEEVVDTEGPVVGPPEPIFIHLTEGDCEGVMEQTDEAVAEIESVDEADQGELVEARLYRGLASLCLGDLGAAIDDLSFARERADELSGFSQGVLDLIDEEDLPTSEEEFRSVLLEHPSAPDLGLEPTEQLTGAEPE